jgi:hypothetical protein
MNVEVHRQAGNRTPLQKLVNMVPRCSGDADMIMEMIGDVGDATEMRCK